MNVYFLVLGATYLRYFIPIAIELVRRGDVPYFILGKSGKYDNPQRFKPEIEALSKKYGFKVLGISEAKIVEGHVITLEGAGIDQLDKSKVEILALTAMGDFVFLYEKYINHVKHVIMPNKIFAKKYEKISAKNLYCGSPKYDVSFNYDEICNKYGLSKKQKVLFMYPFNQDMGLINKGMIHNIYSWLDDLGFEVITKNRKKNPPLEALKGDIYIEDRNWYPHISMELMYVSDFVINFDSTCVKECIMLDTPILNFRVKHMNKKYKNLLSTTNYDFLGFLYDDSFSRQCSLGIGKGEFLDTVGFLNSVPVTEFKVIRDRFLFNTDEQSVSSKICDLMCL